MKGTDLIVRPFKTSEETVNEMLFNALTKIDYLEDLIEVMKEELQDYHRFADILKVKAELEVNEYSSYIRIDWIYKRDEPTFDLVKDMLELEEPVEDPDRDDGDEDLFQSM